MGIFDDLRLELAKFVAAQAAGTGPTSREKILNSDLINIIEAIFAPLPRATRPPLVYVDAATVRIEAGPDCPATLMMNGLPDVFSPDQNISGGLSDGVAREVVANVSMNFGAGDLYGAEKASQQYAVLAIAATADTDFTLKSMPYLRVHEQTSQTIKFGTFLDATVHIGYGFTANEFTAGAIYVLSGASKGLVRTITLNSNGATSPGTITYSGAALSLTQGDFFIILPPTLNFKWLGDIWNNASGNLEITYSLLDRGPGRMVWTVAGNYEFLVPFTGIAGSRLITIKVIGGGAGDGGGGGATEIFHGYPLPPGDLIALTVGAGGGASLGDGGDSVFDTPNLPTVKGGDRSSGAAGGLVDDSVSCEYRLANDNGKDTGASGFYVGKTPALNNPGENGKGNAGANGYVGGSGRVELNW